MTKYRIVKLLILILLAALISPMAECGSVLAKKQIPVKKVKIGRRISLKRGYGEAIFRSSNTRVATVDNQGMVTGKRSGTVKITRKIAQKKQTYTVKVVKNPRKPAVLPVTFDEVVIQEKKMQMQSPQKAVFSVRIRNTASRGSIKKISYHFKIQVKAQPVNDGNGGVASGSAVSGSAITGNDNSGVPAVGTEEADTKTKTVTITAKDIAAGKTSAWLNCEGDYTGLISNMKLTAIDLYTGTARCQYRIADGKYLFDWGTKDNKAPKISGLVKGKSVTGYGDPYQTVYTDRRGRWKPAKFVSAVDDRDGKVKIQTDTSRINWKRSGIYKVYFTAKDRGGNRAKSWAKVRVIATGTAERIADQILRSITRAGWSDEKKARAIYRYVRGRLSYVHNAAHQDWRVTGVRGLRYQSGDCYSYYSVSRLLLSRAGIPNVMIKRYPTPRGMRHYWNLVYVRGGWYHFDTTPRQRNASFCLWTDAQLFTYSRGYTFQFKRQSYVKRAGKRL